jgi:hypothetical protein
MPLTNHTHPFIQTLRNRPWKTQTTRQTHTGLQIYENAYATLKGFEVMRAFKKGQGSLWRYQPDVKGEVWFINRNFGLYAS